MPRTPRIREDNGFFGPGSPTWRVWTHATALIGFQRAVTIETLDPHLTAAVTDQRGVYDEPARRFERTARYFMTVAMGDGRTAVEASEVLHRVHARVTGTDPVTGREYAANDPQSQLWIHLTAWHSILKAYECFGPGPLSPEDEARYWQECAIAAELQTIEPGAVPATRDGVRAYFEAQRPTLALSDAGHGLFFHFLRPRRSRDAWAHWLLWRATSRATKSTLPRWMRRLAGIRQGRVTDALVRVGVRAAIRIANNRRIRTAIMLRVAPSVVPMLEIVDTAHERPELATVTVAEAREQVAATGRRLAVPEGLSMAELRARADALHETENPPFPAGS